MAIAPIKGRLARGIAFDIAGSLSVALVIGYAYWHSYHLPTQNRITDFYIKLDAEKKLKNDA